MRRCEPWIKKNKRGEVSLYLMDTKIWRVLCDITGRMSKPKRFLLAKLLGKKSYVDMLETFSEEDYKLCEMLIGPNGRTIYKMLLVQRGLEDKDYVPEGWREGDPDSALL